MVIFIKAHLDYEISISDTVLQLEERSEEHTSELQSRETISYAVFCLKKKKNNNDYNPLCIPIL